jgi:hypothetical protein
MAMHVETSVSYIVTCYTEIPENQFLNVKYYQAVRIVKET